MLDKSKLPLEFRLQVGVIAVEGEGPVPAILSDLKDGWRMRFGSAADARKMRDKILEIAAEAGASS